MSETEMDQSGRSEKENAEYAEMLETARQHVAKAEQIYSAKLKIEDDIIQEIAPFVSDEIRQKMYLESSSALKKAGRLRDRIKRRTQILTEDIQSRRENRKKDGQSQTSRWTLGRSAKIWERETGKPHLLGGGQSVRTRITREAHDKGN
jgi:hypothetical protein